MTSYIDAKTKEGLEGISNIGINEKFVVSIKAKLEDFDPSYGATSLISDDDLFWLEEAEFEREMEKVDGNNDSYEEQYVSQKRSYYVTNRYCNPFEEMKIINNTFGIVFKSEAILKNPYQSRVLKHEISEMQELLNSRNDCKAFLGQQNIFVKEKTDKEIKSLEDIVNRRFDCADSLKIQRWYYNNNTQYRNNITKARENKEYNCIEILISNVNVSDIKNVLEINRDYKDLKYKILSKKDEEVKVEEDQTISNDHSENLTYIDLAQNLAIEKGKA